VRFREGVVNLHLARLPNGFLLSLPVEVVRIFLWHNHQLPGLLKCLFPCLLMYLIGRPIMHQGVGLLALRQTLHGTPAPIAVSWVTGKTMSWRMLVLVVLLLLLFLAVHLSLLCVVDHHGGMKTKGERHKKPQLNYNLFFHITHKTNRPQLTKPMTTTKSQTPERE
jgi:hypothetical protein